MIEISKQVEQVLKEEGITKEYFQSMIENSAVTSISGYNKRFYNWLFKLEGGKVTMMALDTNTITEGGSGDLVYEDHNKCDGKGCKECGWSGQSSRRIIDTTEAKLNKAYSKWYT